MLGFQMARRGLSTRTRVSHGTQCTCGGFRGTSFSLDSALGARPMPSANGWRSPRFRDKSPLSRPGDGPGRGPGVGAAPARGSARRLVQVLGAVEPARLVEVARAAQDRAGEVGLGEVGAG